MAGGMNPVFSPRSEWFRVVSESKWNAPVRFTRFNIGLDSSGAVWTIGWLALTSVAGNLPFGFVRSGRPSIGIIELGNSHNTAMVFKTRML